MSHPSSERVLVVPGSELDRLGRFQGFHAEAERYLGAYSCLSSCSTGRAARSRTIRASSRSFLMSSFAARDAVFCYKRGTSQGEARLHRLRSLGVGGHVAESDADGQRGYSAYETAMKRELDEEVAIDSPGGMRLVGLINDDSTPVGSVHLGVVHLLELERPSVRPREDGIAEPEFVSLTDLHQIAGEFETWSQICINAFLRAR